VRPRICTVAGRCGTIGPRSTGEGARTIIANSGVDRDIAVRLDGVSKVFAGRRAVIHALDDITLTVPAGQFLSVVGPSGCGKSTMLRVIGGLEHPTSGSVRLGSPGGAAHAPRVAFVFQDNGLFPWLTAAQNVQFGLRMSGTAKKERRDRAAHWLDRVGLTAFADSYPDRLSGGMRQRLSLARAFVTEPDVLLMDEPMGALDAQTRALVQEDLVRLWEENRRTVVMVTHSIDEALLLGDRVLAMSRRPATIMSDVAVELDRPRGMATTASAGFVELKLFLWEALRTEVAASVQGPV
jgi:NitT/TauT family transport system ATP-binding protein